LKQAPLLALLTLSEIERLVAAKEDRAGSPGGLGEWKKKISPRSLKSIRCMV
jgi:hypothetical protein